MTVKRLDLVTMLFIAIALVLGAVVARELTTPSPRARVPRSQPAAPLTAQPAAPSAPAPSAGIGGYATIASRNLFSPTRTEAPPAPPPPAPVVSLPKPNLYGIVLTGETPTAYLEDPVTKRVARYRVGDTVAGGTVKAIESDSVVLARADGQIAVRLHDPTRPRPVPPPAAPPTPSAQPAPAPPQPPSTPPVTPPRPSSAVSRAPRPQMAPGWRDNYPPVPGYTPE